MLRRLLLTLLLFVATERVLAQSATDSVLALEATRRQLWLKSDKDTTGLARMLAPEYIELTPDGRVQTRAVILANRLAGAPPLAIRHDSLVVHIYGNTAVLYGLAEYHGERIAPGGIVTRYTRVFVRRDGRWQAVLQQLTRCGSAAATEQEPIRCPTG